MDIFDPKPWVNPFGLMSIYSTCCTSCFYSLKRRFSVLEYHKRHFPGLYCDKKKKLEKWLFLDQNNGLTPMEKCFFFDFLNFLFLQPRKAIFHSRLSQNTSSWSILRQKKARKMAIFGPKPWVNPYGKMSIFRLFKLLVFIAQTGIFSFQNTIEYIFLVYIG